MASININVAFASKKESPGYTYKDIEIPLKKDSSDHDLKDLRDIDAIKSGIDNIFSWRPGMRVLNPTFGNTLYNFIYEPINVTTSQNLGNEVQKLLKDWEPRVNVESVILDTNEDQNEYYIQLIYSIPSLNLKKEKVAYMIPRV